MSYLLDTHVLLWYRLSPNKLSTAHRDIIRSAETQKFVSAITIWEISLKFALGKLDLGGNTPEEFVDSAEALGFHIITPDVPQFTSFYQLPPVLKHKDPFDRMLIWQAIRSNLALLSHDSQLPKYGLHGLEVA